MSSADRPSGTNVAGSQNQVQNAAEASLDPQSKRAIDFIRMLLVKMAMDAEVSIAPDDGEGGECGDDGDRVDSKPRRRGRRGGRRRSGARAETTPTVSE